MVVQKTTFLLKISLSPDKLKIPDDLEICSFYSIYIVSFTFTINSNFTKISGLNIELTKIGKLKRGNFEILNNFCIDSLKYGNVLLVIMQLLSIEC